MEMPLLPAQYETPTNGLHGAVSCSHLPSDEWNAPVLEGAEESDDEDQSGHECNIQ